MIFFGTTMFPIDLLILRPSPSSTKPWLSTPLYGALPVTATAVDNEELNQPRYWSILLNINQLDAVNLRALLIPLGEKNLNRTIHP